MVGFFVFVNYLFVTEKKICAGVSDFGPYCITDDGQQVSWFPTVYSALQHAYAMEDDWDDYGYKKPIIVSLSDEIKQLYEKEIYENKFPNVLR